MATKLFLRSSQNNGIGATYFDMLPTAGSGTATGVVNTVASGTEIQWTQTAGGSVLQFISGRAPAGGFTLTSTDISIWAHESNGQANCGGRYRVFKRAANGTETEIGGGPFNDGVEFGTSAAEMLWTGNVTDTAFAENDRILLKIYITNVGTMGSGRTCTITYNGADGSTGDSFFNIAETVTFKSETQTGSTGLASETDSAIAAGRASPAGRSDETATALALSFVQVRVAGIATETAAAVNLGVSYGVGRAAEAATAPPLGAAAQVAVASETGAGLALSGLTAAAVGAANDNEEAIGLAGVTIRPAVFAGQTDEGLALAGASLAATGLADENDTAFALTPGGLLVGRTDSAEVAFTLAMGLGVGAANDNSEAGTLSRVALLPVGAASEGDESEYSSGQSEAVGLAVSGESALQVGGALSVAATNENDLALARAVGGLIPPSIITRVGQDQNQATVGRELGRITVVHRPTTEG